MALTRAQKKEMIERVERIVSENETVVFAHFHGLSVADASAMRSGLKEDGVGYMVVKKTLAKRALASASDAVSGDIAELPGEFALAYGDETAPARRLYSFEKEFDNAVSLQGGIFDGAFVDRERMVAIAQIPSLEVLRGMFANVINSPIQRFVIGLGEIAKQKEASA